MTGDPHPLPLRGALESSKSGPISLFSVPSPGQVAKRETFRIKGSRALRRTATQSSRSLSGRASLQIHIPEAGPGNWLFIQF